MQADPLERAQTLALLLGLGFIADASEFAPPPAELKASGPVVVLNRDVNAPTLLIENLRIYPTGPGQTAIKLSFTRVASCINRTFVVRNVQVVTSPAWPWVDIVDVENGWNGVFENVTVNGVPVHAGQPDPVVGNGFKLHGQSTSVSFRGCRANGCYNGFFVTGEAEGTKFTDCEAVGCVNPFVAIADSGNPGTDAEPGLWITDCHFNGTWHGIFLMGRYQVWITRTLIYGADYNVSKDPTQFYGLVTNRCHAVIVQDVRAMPADATMTRIVTPHVGDAIVGRVLGPGEIEALHA